MEGESESERTTMSPSRECKRVEVVELNSVSRVNDNGHARTVP